MSATEHREIIRDQTQRPRRRLYRSRRHRVIAGVCGGIAEYLGWSPTRVRVLTLLSFLLPGTQVILYILMWIFVPSEPRDAYRPI
jgi:phage shock protein C